MEESVHDKNYDNTERLDDAKEAKVPDDKNDKFDEEQEGVMIKMTRTIKFMMKKRQHV